MKWPGKIAVIAAVALAAAAVTWSVKGPPARKLLHDTAKPKTDEVRQQQAPEAGQAAGLVFPEIRKEVHAEPDVNAVTTDFEFTNKSNKTITVVKYDAACSCMAVSIKDSKLRYAPGESGVVRTEFNMGNFSGEVDKSATLWLDGDPEDKSSLVLTVHVVIPELVSLEPKTVKWEVNEAPTPKTVHIKINHTEPIHVLSVTSTNELYTQQLKTVEDGKTYELIVTPLDVKTPSLGIMRLVTDSKIKRFQTQMAFTQVLKPRLADASK